MNRVAASRTKSIRRDMLWLLSMRSAKVAGRVSWLTRSISCCTPSSVTVKLERSRPLTNFPALLYTLASSSTRLVPVSSTISNGFSSMVSRTIWPSSSSASTVISRRSYGFSSSHSTAYGGPSSSTPSSISST